MPPPTIATRAIRWYDTFARDLPWRRPGTTPWGVLVSEVMSQQTPVSRVAPVWTWWLTRWASPADLARCGAGEAIRAWGRLGYPRRALRLHECAQTIVARHGGEVPADVTSLLALPGVGTYTGRAVAAFAFGQRHPVVDTNVRRLVARCVLGRDEAGPTTTTSDLDLVERLLPRQAARAARASAAFMEIGALVCTARTPSCLRCPLRTVCGRPTTGEPQGLDPRPIRRRPTYLGTDRHVRGLLLGQVRDSLDPVPRRLLDGLWPDATQRDRALSGLITDGLLVKIANDRYALPGAG